MMSAHYQTPLGRNWPLSERNQNGRAPAKARTATPRLCIDLRPPALAAPQGVETAIGDQRGDIELDRSHSVHYTIADVGCVRAVGHPEALFQQGAAQRERPDRQHALQCERLEVAVAMLIDVAVAVHVGRERVA